MKCGSEWWIAEADYRSYRAAGNTMTAPTAWRLLELAAADEADELPGADDTQRGCRLSGLHDVPNVAGRLAVRSAKRARRIECRATDPDAVAVDERRMLSGPSDSHCGVEGCVLESDLVGVVADHGLTPADGGGVTLHMVENCFAASAPSERAADRCRTRGIR